MIFAKFMGDSALFGIAEVHLDGQQIEKHVREVQGA